MTPNAIASSSRRPLTPPSSSWKGDQPPRDYSSEMQQMLPSSDDPEPRDKDDYAAFTARHPSHNGPGAFSSAAAGIFIGRPLRNNGLRLPFDRLLMTRREDQDQYDGR